VLPYAPHGTIPPTNSERASVNNEQALRAALVVIALIVFPIGVVYRIRSQATGERLDRRQEGLFILVTLRPAGAALMLAILVFMINPDRMAWSAVPLPMWVRWIGIGIAVLAGALLIWAFSHLGKNLTDTVVTRREHTLVTHGPYRFVRHPFYGSVTLWIVAMSLVTANWFILAAGAVLVTLLIVRTRIEEEKLLMRFGDSYRTYTQQTGRFIPRFRASSSR
jgi:protein-S-isoprenylcysteine O-methyltransferase Ste14